MAKVRPTKPLADVNVLPQADGSIEIVACFLPQNPLGEKAEAVLAIDGSRSMTEMFGVQGPFMSTPNFVQAVARKIGDILCGYTRSGKVTALYWAVGPGGSQVEEIGALDTAGLAAAEFEKPKNMGGGTQLLPVLRYICEQFDPPDAEMVFGVIITDGNMEDVGLSDEQKAKGMEDAKDYCMGVGQELADGKRKDVKLVLIGVGEEVDEGQMEDLDDMFEDTPLNDEGIDIWSHGLAASMRDDLDILGVLFGELVDPEEIIANSGSVMDNNGNVVAEYPDGLKAKLRFVLPKGATGFTIHTPQADVTQDITEGLSKP